MATRCEKTAVSFVDVLCLATALDWIKSRQALNLSRIVRWIAREPITATRRSHFGRLLPPVAAA